MARTSTIQMRRWCPFARTHQDADDATCGWTQCGSPVAERDGSHLLRLRRMNVCSNCEQGYFTARRFQRHVCFDAY